MPRELRRYNKINCIHCAKTFKGDEVAFDFTKVLNEAIEANANNLDRDWSILSKVNLQFNITLMDLFQDFNYEMVDDEYSPIVFNIRTLKRQIEKRTGNSITDCFQWANDFSAPELPLANTMFNAFKEGSVGSPDEVMDNIISLLIMLQDPELEDNSVICTVMINVEVNSSGDSLKNPIVKALNYKIDGVVNKATRICPYCGAPIEDQAGLQDELIIGLAGVSGVGKTNYLAALLHSLEPVEVDESEVVEETHNTGILSKLSGSQEVDDSKKYVELAPEQGESYKKFYEENISKYIQGESITDSHNFNYVYITVAVNGTKHNLIFLDVPGSVFEQEQTNWFLTDCPLYENADYMMYFFNQELIDTGDQTNLGNSNETIINTIGEGKKLAAVVYTNSEINKEFYQPNISVQTEYMIAQNGTGYLDAGNTLLHTNSVYEKIKNTQVGKILPRLFKSYNTFAVSSYGGNPDTISKLKPSLVELPLLWLLTIDGKMDAKKANTGLFNKGTSSVDQSELFAYRKD